MATFETWEKWLSPKAFRSGIPIILDEPGYFLACSILKISFKKNLGKILQSRTIEISGAGGDMLTLLFLGLDCRLNAPMEKYEKEQFKKKLE